MSQAEALQESQASAKETDDGHEETVEEVKAKMKQAQAAMDAGINNAEQQSNAMNVEMGSTPNFGALADMTNTIGRMGMS